MSKKDKDTLPSKSRGSFLNITMVLEKKLKYKMCYFFFNKVLSDFKKSRNVT